MKSTMPVVFLALLWPVESVGQGIPRVEAGWGLDPEAAAWSESRWHDSVSEIYDTWRQYLSNDAMAWAPTTHWSAEEQARWPGYDLTASIAYHGVPATVLDIRPLDPAAPDVFVVRTLFSSVWDGVSMPHALTRVYAVREEGRWVMSNALPRHTDDWPQHEVGPIRYVVEPDLPFSRERAQAAIDEVNALAESLDLPPLNDLTYYAATGPDSLHRALGVDWTFGAMGGGYSNPANRMILSGDPVFGEAHVHELVHQILAPLIAARRVHGIVNEGLATRVGGTAGMEFPEVLATYADFLRENPDVTLDSVLEWSSGPDIGARPAGAVLVLMVEEQAGLEGLQELLRSGQSHDELRATVVRILGASWEEVNALWKERILGAGGPS